MADEKPIKPLACDDPRRQRYAELLAQAGRMTIPDCIRAMLIVL